MWFHGLTIKEDDGLLRFGAVQPDGRNYFTPTTDRPRTQWKSEGTLRIGICRSNKLLPQAASVAAQKRHCGILALSSPKQMHAKQIPLLLVSFLAREEIPVTKSRHYCPFVFRSWHILAGFPLVHCAVHTHKTATRGFSTGIQRAPINVEWERHLVLG